MAGVKMLLNPQLNEYMKDVLFNNFYQQGFVIAINYDDEYLMSDSLIIAPGRKYRCPY